MVIWLFCSKMLLQHRTVSPAEWEKEEARLRLLLMRNTEWLLIIFMNKENKSNVHQNISFQIFREKKGL